MTRGRSAPLEFCFQAEDGIRDKLVTGVQTCALPISRFGGARARLTGTRRYTGGRGPEKPRETLGGVGDAGKIRKEIPRSERLRALPDLPGAVHDAGHGIDDGPAEGGDINRFGILPPGGEPLVDDRQHRAGIVQEVAEVGGQRAVRPGVLEQELRVPDDVIQRGAELVAEMSEGAGPRGHGPALPLRRPSIFASRRSRSTGLVSKSSQPAPMAFSRSPDMAWAVSAITGMPRVSGAALSCRVASHPSRPGRLMSIRMSAGASERAMATPCSPYGDGHVVSAAGEPAREHV